MRLHGDFGKRASEKHREPWARELAGVLEDVTLFEDLGGRLVSLATLREKARP